MDSVAGSASGGNFEGVIRIEEDKIRSHVDEVVRSTVEATLNGLLEAEADELCGAPRYSRSPERLDTRAGHYDRQLHTKAGEVTLSVPRLRSLPFETQIIERYRRRESSVEEAVVEMYLAGVSVRRVEDITEALWGTRIQSQRGERAESEDLRPDRSLAQPTDRRPACVCLHGRHLAEAELGRRGEERGRAGGHWRAGGRLPRNPRRCRGP